MTVQCHNNSIIIIIIIINRELCIIVKTISDTTSADVGRGGIDVVTRVMYADVGKSKSAVCYDAGRRTKDDNDPGVSHIIIVVLI